MRIVLLCVFAACSYGVVHDQITVRVCEEYFTVAHPPLFPTGSLTLLALCWGVAAMGLAALVVGLAGYGLTRNGLLPVPAAVGRMMPAGGEARFMAAWFAHLTSYLVGLAGGALICLRTWQARGRPAAIALLPHGRAATLRATAIILVGVAVWWWRFRAR